MRTESRRPWKFALLAALAALGTSCDDVRITVVEVASLTVTPAEDTLSEGDTLRLRATLQDPSGNSLPDRAVEWTSEDAEVAAVEGSGLVRGLSAGATVIRASSEGATGEASITVLPRASPETSTVDADSTSMVADGSTRAVITVQLRDSRGAPIPFGGDQVALSTTLGSLSDVTDHDDGTYTARLTSPTTEGTATITGTVNGEELEDDARIELVPEPPATITITITAGDGQTGTVGAELPVDLEVRARTAQGSPMGGVTVTWEADDGSASPSSSQTRSNGRATTRWTLGTSPGSQSLRASVAGAGSVTFRATAEDENEEEEEEPTPSPCTELEEILADLRAIEDANPGSDLADKIEDVRQETEEAYFERCVKVPPDRKAAAGNIEGAVDDMEDAVEDRLISADEGTAFMLRLLQVSRTMVIEAIDEARARGGRERDIQRAEDALSEGDALRDAGEFEDAAEKYESAISRAEGA